MAWNIDFGFHNLMTCKGFEVANATTLGPVSLDIGGPCSMAKFFLVILFFLIAILRKWGGEEIGISFSMLWACILGMGGYLLAISLTGSLKLAMLVGIGLACLGGYGAGMFTGGSEVSGYDD